MLGPMHAVSSPPEERDPRVARSRAAILAATSALLVEGGFSGVTIEGIAERAGVAKTTVYRHWKSRSQLVFDAFESMLEPGHGGRAISADVRGDLASILRGLIRGLTVTRWAPAVSALIEAGDRDPELQALVREFLAQRMRPFRKVLGAAIERGELAPDLDIEAAVDMLAGPIFFRRLVSREPLPLEFAERVVEQFLRGAGVR